MIGKHIKLRAVEPSDIDLLYQWENEVEGWFLSNTVTPFSKFLLEEYVANAHLDIYTTKQLRMMIEKTNTHKTIGCIDLYDFDILNNRACMGILICKEDRNKGYASEALSLFIHYSFNTLHLKQLYCNIASENTNSLALFKKFNFEVIGLKKQWLRKDEEWIDEYMLQLIHN